MRQRTSSGAATPEGSIQHWQQQKTGCSKYGIDAHVEGRKAEDPVPRRPRFMCHVTGIEIQSDINAGDGGGR